MSEHSRQERVALYQRDIRAPLPNENEAEYHFMREKAAMADTFIFSEYFGFHSKLRTKGDFLSASEFALEWLKSFSLNEPNLFIVGGSILRVEGDRLFNSTPILYGGEILGYYDKRNLFRKEKKLLAPGSKPLFLRHPRTENLWSFLICFDVMLPGIFKELQMADFIAIPTNSPLKKESEATRHKRDQTIYARGATEAHASLFKCCSVGQVGKDRFFRKAPRLQGRSLIAAPGKILWRAPDIHWRGIAISGSDVANSAVASEEYRP